MKNNLLVLIISLIVVTMQAWAEDNWGPDKMDIFSGRKASVPFSHRAHQTAVGDCNVCHMTFPQKSGAIQEQVESGVLAEKHVMNAVCVKCHRERKAAGLESGPTACSKCHIK